MKANCGFILIGILSGIFFNAFGQQPGSKIWEFPTHGAVNSCPAIGMDGTLYIGSEDGKLYAINPDGSERWSFDAGLSVDASPVLDVDGTIFFGAGPKLFALAPNGTKKWEYDAGVKVNGSPALGSKGLLHFVSADGKLHALFRRYGIRVWTFSEEYVYTFLQFAVVQDGTIFVTGRTNLLAIRSDGILKWKHAPGSSPSELNHSPIVAADGAIMIAKRELASLNLYWINPDGSPRKSATIAEVNLPMPPGGVSPAIGPDGTIYVGVGDGDFPGYPRTSLNYFTAIDPSGAVKLDLDIIRTFVNERVGASSPSIASDGTIYFGVLTGTDKGVMAVSASGKTLWFFHTPDTACAYSSPAIGADGTVYFGASTNVYAVKGTSPLAHSPWPMTGRDLRRSCTAWYRETLPNFDEPRFSSGAFVFTLVGQPGSNYSVYASSDLVDWKGLTNTASANGAIEVQDSDARNFTHRFYKSVAP